MWYHFAFVAISVAMFGMTEGAILVYLNPGYFLAEKTKINLFTASLLFAIFIILIKFKKYVRKLYGFNLAGAAVGCVLLIYSLKYTDGLTAVFVTALFAVIGAAFFAMEAGAKKIMQMAIVFARSEERRVGKECRSRW